jgi:hypothetical protein
VFEIPVESKKDQKKFINEMNDEVKLYNDIWPDIKLQTTDDTFNYYLKEDVRSEQDIVCLYCVNENNVETCPQIQILIGNQPCRELTDTGCQCSIILEELYNEFKARGLDSLELPTQNVILKSAFTGRTQRVKRQALVKLRINVSLDEIILISSQLVTSLLLGTDFCMDNHVVIDFPNKTIVINADDEESATEVDLVNERRNIDNSIDGPVTRAINLGTAELPPTPQLDCTVNPSISNPPTLLYNARLPEKDLCPNQMTVNGTTMFNAVYGLFSWNAEDTNNKGKAKRANNPNKYKNMNSAIAEGKYEHTDANVIRNIEVRSLTLENEGGIGRDGMLQGRCNVGITHSYDVEGLDKGE